MSNVPKNKTHAAVLYREGHPDYIVLSTGTDPIPDANEAGAILEYSDTGDRFRWSSTAWIRTGTGGAKSTSNFFLDISKGLIPGHASIVISARNPSVSTSIEDVWDVGGTIVYPTAGEQWELVSDSVNDTSAGTGAQKITVDYLDDNFILQSEEVTMNGTTAVTLTATNSFRPRTITTTAAGSGAENAGVVTLRVASGGNPRGAMLAGENISMSSHYTVPAGRTAYLTTILEEINKGEDVVLQFKRTEGPNGIFLTRGKSAIYQSVNISNFTLFHPIIEKSDTKVTAVSSNALAAPFIFIELIEVTN